MVQKNGTLLVTGGAGFIGSSFVRKALEHKYKVTVLDALTYAGNRKNLAGVHCEFIHGNICDFNLLDQLFSKEKFSGVVHFAAESHVDNSISGPKVFLETNIFGTFHLLEAARKHRLQEQKDFRFIHVSTDEVFGALGETGKFAETSPYAPNSPYSATKAASDHLARAWHHTYQIPTVITNCSNNYGPRQFAEKLIPTMISHAFAGKPLPVYGKGANVRDWIHVEDHCDGILLALQKGRPGASYCFGGNSERSNLDLVKSLCQIMDELSPRPGGKKHQDSIQFVQDRPGHDFRYAIDDSLAIRELGFTRRFSDFEAGLRQTIKWYLENGEGSTSQS